MLDVLLRWRISKHNVHLFTRLCRASSSSSSRPVDPATNRPTNLRGGQNLSDRHTRLAKMIRGKGHFRDEIQEFSSPSEMLQQKAPGVATMDSGGNTFRGFRVPDEPSPPEADECCMSGCAICVYDLYEESLRTFRQSVAALRHSLVQMQIPETEWPANIRQKDSSGSVKRPVPNNASMSAFEELERSLNRKQTRSAAR